MHVHGVDLATELCSALYHSLFNTACRSPCPDACVYIRQLISHMHMHTRMRGTASAAKDGLYIPLGMGALINSFYMQHI